MGWTFSSMNALVCFFKKLLCDRMLDLRPHISRQRESDHWLSPAAPGYFSNAGFNEAEPLMQRDTGEIGAQCRANNFPNKWKFSKRIVEAIIHERSARTLG